MTNENETSDPKIDEEAEIKELQERIARAQEQREQAEQKREAMRRSPAELRKQLEREEQAAKDAEALLAAEQEHGVNRVASIETEEGLIIVKRPNPLHFKRFQDKDKHKVDDFEQLVRPCVIHPSKARFDEICENLPATLMRCANAVVQLAGFRARDLAGK